MLFYTNHALLRMKKRGISKDFIEKVIEYGYEVSFGKYSIFRLTRRTAKKLNMNGINLKSAIEVILQDNKVITAYRKP